MRDRVYGIETEYAILFEPRHGGAERPTALALFELIETELKARFRTLPSHTRGKRGLFLENGALVTFETTDGVNGLLEMSTPECRTARDVTVYQAALDVLAADLAKAVTRRLRGGPDAGTVRFGKCSADGKGHTFGTHENYWIEDPSPRLRGADRLMLGACRAVWACTVASIFITAWVIAGAALALVLLAGVAAAVLLGVVACEAAVVRLVLLPFGRGREAFGAVSWTCDWLKRPAAWLFETLERGTQGIAVHGLPLLARPATFLYDRLLTRTAMRPIVDGLASFLATRPIWCGAGRVWLEPARRGGRERRPTQPFQLSARAARVRRVSGAGAHPDYMFDLKSLVLGHTAVEASRKRLEIVCGDSNMSEMCVYMKVGVTGLLLRMLEEGESVDDLSLADPVKALETASADEALGAELEMADGRRLTALDVQRAWLRRATTFYEAREADAEARRLLAMWSRTLDALAHDPSSLAPQVDWIAKRVLMRSLATAAGCTLDEVEAVMPVAPDVAAHCGPVAAGASERVVRERLRRAMPRARFERVRALVEYREMPWTRLVTLSQVAYQMRRLDLRYHELGEQAGGYELLRAAGATRGLSSEPERAMALLVAPRGTRAERRAELVREHAERAASRVSVTWDHFRGPTRAADESLGEPL